MKKVCIALASLFTMGFVSAQTVDEVINKHIEAVGGKEKIEKIQNLVMEGSLSIQGMQIAVTTTSVQGKLNRADINAAGMKNFDLTTDKEGWVFMPIQGMQKPEPKTADDLKDVKSDLDLQGSIVNYAAKGHKAELLGKEDVEGTECYKIKLTLSTGTEVTYFIDPTTYMIIRQKQMKKANGQEAEIVTDFSDYKDVEGVKMPHSVSLPFGVMVMSSIKANQQIDEKLYKHD